MGELSILLIIVFCYGVYTAFTFKQSIKEYKKFKSYPYYSILIKDIAVMLLSILIFILWILKKTIFLD